MEYHIKKQLKILTYALFLLSVIQMPAATIVHSIALSPEQEIEYQKLTKLYALQISHLFDLCTTGKNPHYKRLEPGEFEHSFKKLENSILDTIQNIATLYTKIGIPQSDIKEEEALLRAGIQNCLS